MIAAGLQDPGNLGTLVRSAEAFGATGMILLPGTVSLWNAKVLRASSGSAFRLPVVSWARRKPSLRCRRGACVCARLWLRDGDSEMQLHLPSALLLGNEGAGLPEAWVARADVRVTIPCPGPVESLNAAVAGSVLLYEAMRQRRSGGARMSLFNQIPEEASLKRGAGARMAPLAERMRPRTLDEYVGQEQLLGPGKPLRMEIERDDPGS